MKKTIITVLALTGGVSADAVNTSQLISDIQEQLTLQDYKVGDSFAISFDIDTLGYSANSANIIVLGTEFGASNTGIRIQSSVGLTSAYLGVRISNSESWKTQETVWDSVTKTNTLTLDSLSGVWFSMGENHTQTANDLTGSTLTLKYDADSVVSSYILTMSNGVTNVLNYKNVEWNAQGLAAGYNGTTWKNLSVSVTKKTPEPTTATLSLLALAGLAARRRRR